MRDDAKPGTKRDRSGWMRLWPIALLLAGLGLAFALDGHRWLSLTTLAEHRDWLMQLVAGHPVLAGLVYLLVYVAVTAVATPGTMVLTMAGGFLFGRWLGTALAVLAATAGTCLLFVAVHSSLAPLAARRAGQFLDRLQPGLERAGFWYLVSLRLLPVVPFWAATVAAALVGMRLRSFAAGTALGILPGTAIFAGIGAGLDAAFSRGAQPDLGAVLSASTVLPLLALAGVALLLGWWARRRLG